uniref:Protein E7 n=1 Tax=Enhydra lutris kenyoni papillomavirus 2 TaxID=3073258 RepID=A0AA51ZRG1_9PAPI|nr:E7 [Enhydra lutris kenyoni papillomavirus 2]
MHGQCPTLPDIVLSEQQPEVIDLQCYEEMPSEEEEEQDLRDPFRVTVDCGVCKRRVRFVVLSDRGDLQSLQDLLFRISFLCVPCVKTNKYNHGG